MQHFSNKNFMGPIAPFGKLKRKVAQTPIAPWQLSKCLECGEYPQAVVQGVLHPFCSRNCARKYNKRTHTLATVAPMMPIMPPPYPDFNMCKGCGVSPQALSPQGCLLTHCSAACSSTRPLKMVRCAFEDCQEFISGAYGEFCAVLHRHLYVPHLVIPPTTAQPTGLKRLNPFRVFSRPKSRILFYDKHDPYFGFTNFSAHSVTYKGVVYPTSEHLYQSFKFAKTRPDIANHIRTCSENPRVAFNEAHKFQQYMRPDWLKVNILKMEETLWHKFNQHPYLAAELLSTGDAELIEDSPIDAFWGVGRDRKGRNELGKALMRLRLRLQKNN